MNKFFFKKHLIINLSLACRGIGIVCLFQTIILFPNYYDIYGSKGISRSSLNSMFSSPFDLTIDKVSFFLHLPDFIVVNILIALLVILSILCIKDGKNTIIIGILWFIHLILVNSSFLFSYGADYMITFSLSFLFITSLIIDLRKTLNLSITENEILSFSTRILQLFLYVVYFFGGLGKVVGLDWFNGNAMWKVMVYYQYDLVKSIYTVIPNWMWVVTGWIFMFTELLYPILISNKYTKNLTLIILICMHIGIGLFINLYVFAAIMIYFNLICFYFSNPSKDDSTEQIAILA